MKKVLLILLVMLLAVSTVGCTKTIKYDNGNVKFKGEWKNGMANGIGIEYFEDGSEKYNGSFKDGSYSGIGTVSYENGDTYKGELENGNANGIGILTSNSMKYTGTFVNNFLFDGTIYDNGDIIVNVSNGDRKLSEAIVNFLEDSINEMYILLLSDLQNGELRKIKKYVAKDSNAWETLSDFTQESRDDVNIWFRDPLLIDIGSKGTSAAKYDYSLNKITLSSDTFTTIAATPEYAEYTFDYTFEKKSKDWIITKLNITRVTPLPTT